MLLRVSENSIKKKRLQAAIFLFRQIVLGLGQLKFVVYTPTNFKNLKAFKNCDYLDC
jgi:hypothetical protein